MSAAPSANRISATYRLQFNKSFTFRDAMNLLDYLRDLGTTHIYASPILAARHGSMHGYDVIDPTRLNPELGTEADFHALQEKLRCRELWVMGANKYRNPDDDLPQDFDIQREEYYRALGQPFRSDRRR